MRLIDLMAQSGIAAGSRGIIRIRLQLVSPFCNLTAEISVRVSSLAAVLSPISASNARGGYENRSSAVGGITLPGAFLS